MFVVSIKQHPIKKTNEYVDIQKAGLDQTHFFPLLLCHSRTVY